MRGRSYLNCRYFNRIYIWHNKPYPLLIIRAVKDGQYYISSPSSKKLETDVGPYRLLRDAQVAVETMVLMGHIPESLK